VERAFWVAELRVGDIADAVGEGSGGAGSDSDWGVDKSNGDWSRCDNTITSVDRRDEGCAERQSSYRPTYSSS
jgi:hypothetical protein